MAVLSPTRRASAAYAWPRNRTNPETIWIGSAGGLIALGAGAAAATGHGVLVLGAMVVLAAGAAGVVTYLRDPVRALTLLWLLVVFDAPLATLAGYDSSAGQLIRQADEPVVLLLVALTARRAFLTNTRIPTRFVLPAVAVVICGLLGAAIHHVPLHVTLVGLWLGMKLWIMIVVALLLPWKLPDVGRVYRLVTSVGVLVAILGIADYLTHNAASTALHLGVTFQTTSTRPDAVYAIFPHPNEFSLFMSMLFALSFTRFALRPRRSDLALAVLFAISVLFSLRLKGFLSLAAVVMVVIFARSVMQDAVHRRRGLAVAVVGSILLVGVYALESKVIERQLSLYTSTESTARAQLYATGEQIASDDLPLGAGFGRFASYASRLYYSPVYDQYDLGSVYGLSREHPDFIDDVAWPSVIGETGYAGFAAYVIGLFIVAAALTGRVRRVAAEWKWVPLAALCVLVVILADSLGDPSLFDWVPAISFALIFGPAMLAPLGREPQKADAGA